jgi:glycosyltransferase involved in cell wall biosynthesis
VEIVKRIWLVNQYAMPPEYESRLRTIKFAQYLIEAGYDVTIFASSMMHNMGIDLITDGLPYIERSYGNLKFIHIKTGAYKGNSILRLWSMLQFPLKLFYFKKCFDKPDIIIHTATVPFGNVMYYTAKRLRAKYIVEVLDLWPEGFVAFNLISPRNPFLKLAYKAERWLYAKADKLIFSMEGGRDYIIEKKWDTSHKGIVDVKKISYINNGVDVNDFHSNSNNYFLDDADILDESTFKVTYLGSIRLANGLQYLIDAASYLKENSKIKFLIYGDGDDRDGLEKYCLENGITNVLFKQKWIDPKYVPFVLSHSSLNVLNYQPNSIWKYGGSQSKLFQYMASGKPICSNLEMGYCPINKYNLGIAKNFKSAKEYSDAILSLVNMDAISYDEMCNRARVVALQYDYKILTNKLIEILN